MRITPTLAALIAAALSLAGCDKLDQAFDNRVHAYLMAHPEVISEAIDKLRAKQQAEAINQNREALERDPRDFVANPNGKITVSEFYDYRCPHCINVAPAVVSLIAANADVRFVFKEYPIFGAASDRAALGAIAVKRAGGDYVGLYHAFMTARPLDDTSVDQILAAHGVTPAMLDDPTLKIAAAQQISAVRSLAAGIGVEGTPAFIIGDTMIPGEDMAGVRAAITAARNAGKS